MRNRQHIQEKRALAKIRYKKLRTEGKQQFHCWTIYIYNQIFFKQFPQTIANDNYKKPIEIKNL